MASRPNRKPLLVRIRHARGRAFRRLAALGAAIVWPFERAFSRLGRKVAHGAARVEKVESVFVGLGWALSWPVRLVSRLTRAAAAACVPESARKGLTAPFRGMSRLGRASGKAFMRTAEALNLDGAVLWIVRWTRFFWYPFAALWGFFHAWLATRSYKKLLWGLPVVAVLVPLAGIAIWMNFRGRGAIATRYRVAVNEAREAKQYERVELYERKLAQLGVSTQMTEFQTAHALAQDGKHAEAYQRMQRLAPTDRPGYPAAHAWTIQQLLGGRLQIPPDESQRLIKIHLDHLQSLGVKSVDVDLWRALWLAKNNQLAEASKLLKPIASRYPPAAIFRMEISHALNQIDETRSDAHLVRAHMQDRARRGDAFNVQDYRSWAFAEDLLGDVAKAHSLVEQWLKLEPDNQLARTFYANLSGQLFERALAAPDPDPERLASLFIRSAEYTDDAQRLREQVTALYQLRARLPVVQSVVDRVVSYPRTPASVMEAIGTVAATVGEHDDAKRYLLLAVKKDPGNSIAWNNYAWLVIQDRDADLEIALEAVNKALAIRPDEFRFRETRGQILLRQGRWQEAVDDLEFAANGIPESREIHLSLAKAYDALGEAHLAQVHREHAE